MSSQAKTRLLLAALGVSAGAVSFPADLAAQAESGQPPGTLSVWIEAARASPFHDLMVSGTPANPAVEAPDDSITQTSRQRGLVRRVFAYTSLAAFVPMVPAFITSSSPSSEGLMWIFLGSAVTLVSVPVAALAAGATSGPRAIAGSVTGLVAGVAFGMIVANYWGNPGSRPSIR